VTPTITPTVTPSSAGFLAYLFPEPSDLTSKNELGQWMLDQSADWFGYWNNAGIPGASNYSNNLDAYAHFSGFNGTGGNFITPVTSLTSSIRQAAGVGTDSYGQSQNQYTFGTIAVTTLQINPAIQYFYSIWFLLSGVGGSMSNMTVDAGTGSAGATNIVNDGIPDSGDAGINVTVTAGAVIPAGTYRVLWMSPLLEQPTSPPAGATLYIKGDTKTG
jgi:hypothetical protein